MYHRHPIIIVRLGNRPEMRSTISHAARCPGPRGQFPACVYLNKTTSLTAVLVYTKRWISHANQCVQCTRKQQQWGSGTGVVSAVQNRCDHATGNLARTRSLNSPTDRLQFFETRRDKRGCCDPLSSWSLVQNRCDRASAKLGRALCCETVQPTF